MTPSSRSDPSVLRGLDPLDVRLADATTPVAGLPVRTFPTRLSSLFGWSTTSVPVALLLLMGMAIGPRGIGLLSADALAFLDPMLPVTLAALGVLIGLGVSVYRSHDGHLLAIAGIEAGLTTLVVAIGTMLIAPALMTVTGLPLGMLGAIAGICAATSSIVPTGNPAEPGERSNHVIELDVLLAIMFGGLVLASIRENSFILTLSWAGQACVVVLMLATAGWLLLTQSGSDTEQRVFTVASLLLVGGAADYLSLSALLGGLLGGVLWQRAGGQARESMRRDALYVQHPLLVLLLLVAGASVEFGPASLGLAIVYVLLRTAGKLAGGWTARRFVPTAVPHQLSLRLLSPGVFGVAFALNTVRVAGPESSVLLTVAVLGTIGSELFAGLVDRPELPK